MNDLHRDANILIKKSLEANLPQAAVRKALQDHVFSGNIHLLAIGKAAWTMAHTAHEVLGNRIKQGIVVTKYEHSQGDIPGMEIIEAGHPLSDSNTIAGAHKAVAMAKGLTEKDELLFLISGGGSALFELPLDGITLEDIIDINNQLLASGADIVEINMIRKRLSAVKGGRFAQLSAPAKVFTVVLSDVLGDRLDSIASGPAAPDMSTVEDAANVARKYNLVLSDRIREYLKLETPKSLDNVETVITGSVRTLCESVASLAQELGYTPYIVCSEMNCEAADAGRLIAAAARQVGMGEHSAQAPCALIFGGETVVHVRGKGKGGRNQELALAAAEGIADCERILIFSFGSDGTDGPTDAAGGIVDGSTVHQLQAKGLKIQDILANNDAYHGLKAIDSLIMTGPSGTNVNDVAVVLCR